MMIFFAGSVTIGFLIAFLLARVGRMLTTNGEPPSAVIWSARIASLGAIPSALLSSSVATLRDDTWDGVASFACLMALCTFCGALMGSLRPPEA